MGFKVKYHPYTQLPTDEHGDEASFTILEGGVLKVESADTDGKTFYIVPSVWHTVMADKGHLAKPTPGPATAPAFLKRG